MGGYVCLCVCNKVCVRKNPNYAVLLNGNGRFLMIQFLPQHALYKTLLLEQVHNLSIYFE